ncbi:MAG: sigma-70 family RNA polymerase sigma factor [Lachnospiraceae bacterium]|nr:sigma-70 family RNA polymerase sigma factor [Lachnospiraceae bacterium]
MTKEQFGELIMTNKESLYRVAKSILRNDDDCADAIEEAIVKGFENLRSLKKDEFAKTWLIRILLNECYSIYRFKQKYADDLPEQSYDSDDYSDLHEALYKLNDKQRLAVSLHYLDGYSIREVARILKTSEAAVKMNLSRARKLLKGYLEE